MIFVTDQNIRELGGKKLFFCYVKVPDAQTKEKTSQVENIFLLQLDMTIFNEIFTLQNRHVYNR